MALIRRKPIAALVLCLLALALLVLPQTPAWALELRGRVLGPNGQGLAGAIISDQAELAISDAQGGWRLETQPGRLVSLSAPVGYRVKGSWWLPVEQAEGKVFTLEPAPTGPALTLALISDPHLLAEGDQDAGCQARGFDPKRPMAVWEKMARQAAALRPDLTIVAGDLALDADHAGLPCAQAQMASAAQALLSLPAPVRALPGNHDVLYPEPDGSQGPAPVDFSLWRQHFGPQRQVYLLEGLAFILLDNPGRGRARDGKPRSLGWLSPEARDWLAKALRLLPKDMPLVVVSHYPLASTLAGANPLYKGALVEEVAGEPASPSALALRDTDQAAAQTLALLRERRVLALISGHEHAYHEALLHLGQGPLRLLALPALSGRWWQGNRPWGPLEFPPGWISLTIDHAPARPALRCVFHPAGF